MSWQSVALLSQAFANAAFIMAQVFPQVLVPPESLPLILGQVAINLAFVTIFQIIEQDAGDVIGARNPPKEGGQA